MHSSIYQRLKLYEAWIDHPLLASCILDLVMHAQFMSILFCLAWAASSIVHMNLCLTSSETSNIISLYIHLRICMHVYM